jgi:hypothetical protein
MDWRRNTSPSVRKEKGTNRDRIAENTSRLTDAPRITLFQMGFVGLTVKGHGTLSERIVSEDLA